MEQTNKLISYCFYLLTILSKILAFIPFELQKAVIFLVLSRLNYCNALYLGMQKGSLKLHRVENAAAELIKNIRKFDSVSKALEELHWLMIKKSGLQGTGYSIQNTSLVQTI